MRTLLLLVMMLALAGCSLFGPKKKPVPPPSYDDIKEEIKPFEVDRRLLQKCEGLKQVNPATMTNQLGILAQREADLKAYTECASRHNSLVDVILKFVNAR